MSQDPQNFYHLMLGLPVAASLPDHYELLDLERFEDDVARIRTAAVTRNGQLLSWQNSEFHADADHLIDEIVAARTVLLDPQQKAAYDRQLGRNAAAAPIEMTVSPTPRPSAESRPSPPVTISEVGERRSMTNESSAVFAALSTLKRRAFQFFSQPTAWVASDRRWRLATGAALLGISLLGVWQFFGKRGAPAAVPTAWSPALRTAATSPASSGASLASLVAPFTVAEARAAQLAAAQALGATRTAERNSIGLEMVLIPPGKFLMGSPDSDRDASVDERPQVEVTLSQPFYVGRTEVTQGQWQAIMHTTPWSGLGQPGARVGANQAATHVSWIDAQEFCKRLSQTEGVTYRLLLEAEWEYACRAGTDTKYHFGDDESSLATYAWFDQNSMGESHAHDVGQKQENPFGLLDMHGNVWEWCADWYDVPLAGGIDPSGPVTGSRRVIRGGGWHYSAWNCRSAYRGSYPREHHDEHLGFRIAAVAGSLLSPTAKPPAEAVPAITRNSQPAASAAAPSPPSAVPPPSEPPPAPLVAPFTAVQAQAAQQAWARSLGKTGFVEQNSVGMELVLIPPGKFMMGENPPVEVTLTRPLYVGKTEVTQGQWQAVMNSTPWGRQNGIKVEPNCPATNVSWNDAQEFCKRLGEQEGRTYRLLTEAEAEFACRAGTDTKYHFGDSEASLGRYAWFYGNTAAVGENYSHEVGRKEANQFGLHDTHGNAWEWCEDWHGVPLAGGINPAGPAQGSSRVFRSGGWNAVAMYCRSASRYGGTPSIPSYLLGFRVAAVPSIQPFAADEAGSMPSTTPQESHNPVPPGSPLASLTAPFTAADAQAAQQAWAQALEKTDPVVQNSIGMELVLIPPGKFMMGENLDVEVTLAQPLYVGKTEVTQGQWQAVMHSSPWRIRNATRQAIPGNPNYPATNVNWNEAQAFCQKLGELENRAYRLLTEAEWEYACRAGTTTKYYFGDDENALGIYAWFNGNTVADEAHLHEVGQKQPNPFGLHDMHGNADEWCADWQHARLAGGNDPTGPARGSVRVSRGGNWTVRAGYCGSAFRNGHAPVYRVHFLGFRVAAVPLSTALAAAQARRANATPMPTMESPASDPAVRDSTRSVRLVQKFSPGQQLNYLGVPRRAAAKWKQGDQVRIGTETFTIEQVVTTPNASFDRVVVSERPIQTHEKDAEIEYLIKLVAPFRPEQVLNYFGLPPRAAAEWQPGDRVRIGAETFTIEEVNSNNSSDMLVVRERPTQTHATGTEVKYLGAK